MIEVLTVLKEEIILKFSKFNLMRNKFTLFIIPILLILLSIVLLILNIEKFVLPIIGICLAVLVPVAMIFVNSLFTKVTFKHEQEGDTYFKFLFNQNNYEVENNIGGLVTTNVLLYQHILKCFETKLYFYLYVNKNYAYIVDKAGFQNGSAEELSELLKFNCRKYKFINK